MRLKFLMVVLSAAFLAACGSDTDRSGATTGAGTTATTGTTGGTSQPTVSSESVAGPSAGSQEDLLVNVGDRVFFGYDRSDLSPQGLGKDPDSHGEGPAGPDEQLMQGRHG